MLKCNHDSGSTIIVDSDTDRDEAGRLLDKALGIKYGYRHGELFYNGIEPCIMAEEFLGEGSGAPADYKVWCFGGKPYCIWACMDRTADSVYVNMYNTDWTPREGVSVFTAHYRDGRFAHPRPRNLQRMLDAAARLSEGFPEVRVDFYEVGGKLYFGEMTFASFMGRVDFYTDAFLEEMGDQIVLPQR